jgi:hypothetical protein
VTRQRVSQLKKDPTFPRSGFHGWGASVWEAAGIECWAAAHRPDQTDAAGRFAGEAGALLLAAEVEAQVARVNFVDTAAIWYAVARSASGEALARALGSMGITADEMEAYYRSRASAQRGSSCRMTPHLQSFLAAADRQAAVDGRRTVRPVDILLAFIDAPWERHALQRKATSPDNTLHMFHTRGVDPVELRRRLVAADTDPTVVSAFEQRKLRKPRSRARKRPDFEMAPNPLGHDPWTRHPWGAAFARTRDGRHLKVDGEVWFFTIDGDGFYVRAADGRPVGYRYRMEPPPRLRKGQRYVKPVNGFTEVLPMPPVEMADWPDRRFESDD